MKDLYKALNKVDVDTTEYESMELTDLEKKRLKRKMKKKLKGRKKVGKAKVGGIALAIVFMLTFGISNNVITLAKVPIIGGLLEDYLGMDGNQSLADYKTVIGESVKNKGVEVTLNEVLLDEGRLLISSTFHTDFSDADLAYNWFSHIEVFVNGSKHALIGGGGGPEKLTDSSVDYFWAADLDGIELEDNQHIKIVFNDLRRSDEKEVKAGKWSFEFMASGEKLMAERKIIPIQKHFTLENGEKITVEDIVLTPISTILHYQRFSAGGEQTNYDLAFTLEDEKGKIYDFTSGSGSGNGDENGFTEAVLLRFEPLDGKVTKLRLTPSLNKEMSDVYVELPHEVFEIEL